MNRPLVSDLRYNMYLPQLASNKSHVHRPDYTQCTTETSQKTPKPQLQNPYEHPPNSSLCSSAPPQHPAQTEIQQHLKSIGDNNIRSNSTTVQCNGCHMRHCTLFHHDWNTNFITTCGSNSFPLLTTYRIYHCVHESTNSSCTYPIQLQHVVIVYLVTFHTTISRSIWDLFRQFNCNGLRNRKKHLIIRVCNIIRKDRMRDIMEVQHSLLKELLTTK